MIVFADTLSKALVAFITSYLVIRFSSSLSPVELIQSAEYFTLNRFVMSERTFALP